MPSRVTQFIYGFSSFQYFYRITTWCHAYGARAARAQFVKFDGLAFFRYTLTLRAHFGSASLTALPKTEHTHAFSMCQRFRNRKKTATKRIEYSAGCVRNGSYDVHAPGRRQNYNATHRSGLCA